MPYLEFVVDWDVKNQIKQTKIMLSLRLYSSFITSGPGIKLDMLRGKSNGHVSGKFRT